MYDRSGDRRHGDPEGRRKHDLPNTVTPEKGDDAKKYTKGLELYNSSFADVYENIATMGAKAAKSLVERN